MKKKLRAAICMAVLGLSFYAGTASTQAESGFDIETNDIYLTLANHSDQHIPVQFAAQSNQGWVLLNTQGQPLNDTIYKDISLLLKIEKMDGDPKSATYQTHLYNEVKYMIEEGLVPVKESRGIGFVNSDGQVIVPSIADRRTWWHDNRVNIDTGNMYISYDKEGHELGRVDKKVYHGFTLEDRFDVPLKPNQSFKGVDPANRVHFAEKQKHGLMNMDGSLIFTPQYKDIVFVNKNSYWVKKDKEYALVDLNGKEISPNHYTFVSKYTDGRAAVQGKHSHQRYAYIDEKGNLLTKYDYISVQAYSEGLAAATLAHERGNTKSVYLDRNGQEVFGMPHKDILPFKNGLGGFKREVKSGFLGSLMQIGLSLAFGGMAQLGPDHHETKIGVYDRTGKEILDGKDDAVIFIPSKSPQYFIRYRDNKAYLTNLQGEDIFEALNITAFANKKGFLFTTDQNKMGAYLIDEHRITIPARYPKLEDIYSDRFIYYEDDNHLGIMDQYGKRLTPAIYKKIGRYSIGYVVAQDQQKHFVVLDLEGQIVSTLPADVEDTGLVYDGTLPVRVKGKWGLMDIHGNYLTKPIYKQLNFV